MTDRQRRLDEIRAIAERLENIAKHYGKLRWMAEQPTATDAFLDLAEAAGRLTVDSLDRTAALLDILAQANLNSASEQ